MGCGRETHICIQMRTLFTYRRDRFFAHVPRKKGDVHEGTTWHIRFKLENIDQKANYKLRVAIASATLAELQIRVNDAEASRPLFTTGLIGKNNSIARHGIHGVYRLYEVNIPGNPLVQGEHYIPETAKVQWSLSRDYV